MKVPMLTRTIALVMAVALAACSSLTEPTSRTGDGRRPTTITPSGPREPATVAREPLPPLGAGVGDQKAADQKTAPAYDPNRVRVAILLPLTGALGKVGTSMLQSAQMAVFDVADGNFDLLPYDTKGQPDVAEKAGRRAIDEGASLLIGPLLAASVRAVTPVAQAADVPVLSLSNDRKVAKPRVYVLGVAPEAEVQRVIEFAVEHGRKRLIVIGPNDAYGKTVVEAVRKAGEQRAFTLEKVELYDPNSSDFTAVLERATQPKTPPSPTPAPTASAPSSTTAATGAPLPRPVLAGGAAASTPTPGGTPLAPVADALLIADGGNRLKAISAVLAAKPQLVAGMQLLGTGAWDDASLRSEPGLLGAYYAAPDPVFREGFEARYRTLFGADPQRLATIAYDATALAATIARGETGRPFTEAKLTDANGFLGRDGLFRLQANGVADRRLAVLRIDPGYVTVVSEGQRSFPGS